MNLFERHPLPWRFVPANGDLKYEDGDPKTAEDDCIVDANDHEVFGSSEWMRGGENFPDIIAIINLFPEMATAIRQVSELNNKLEEMK